MLKMFFMPFSAHFWRFLGDSLLVSCQTCCAKQTEVVSNFKASDSTKHEKVKFLSELSKDSCEDHISLSRRTAHHCSSDQ